MPEKLLSFSEFRYAAERRCRTDTGHRNRHDIVENEHDAATETGDRGYAGIWIPCSLYLIRFQKSHIHIKMLSISYLNTCLPMYYQQ